MSVMDPQTQPHNVHTTARPAIINNFSIVAATINGSGSQTANTVIIRSLFKMGIPVSGKNLFPSNIAGLPTWYTIRINKDNYIARRDTTEILVAFNAKTADEDLAALPSGGVCIHPDDLTFTDRREDVIYYALPVKELVKATGADVKLRDYVANMAYVGALAQLLAIDMDEIRTALVRHFKGKTKPVELNYGMVAAAADWVREHITKTDPYRVEPMDGTDGQTMIEGNAAAAIGSLVGGMTVTAWYPITPSTSLVDSLTEYATKLRLDADTGLPTYAIIQAEDELAAAGMIVGAGWAGARAMTATSGPGFSLMTEFAGLAYFAEVPAVIWNIMRMGPSTGLPTRVSQGDILAAYTMGHGDTRHVCLLPSSMTECYEFGYQAFDLADRLQTVVFVLSDLDLGMNLWMTEPFVYPSEPIDHGKILSAEELREVETWGRYRDVDNDGITYRTLPGNTNPRSAYLARGTGHNDFAVYSERSEDWQANLDRLTKKHETARTLVPKPVVDQAADASIGLISYGSNDPAIREARDILRKEDNLETNYLRLRALPLETTTKTFVEQHDRIYVLELNQDGQMHQLIQHYLPEHAEKIHSIRICDGLPMSTDFVVDTLRQTESQRT